MVFRHFYLDKTAKICYYIWSCWSQTIAFRRCTGPHRRPLQHFHHVGESNTMWLAIYFALGIFFVWLMNWLFPSTAQSCDDLADEGMATLAMIFLWPLMLPFVLLEYAWKKYKKSPYVR